jgi:anti-sigma factor (TIGR02949 family)
MDCPEARSLLHAHADGELSPGDMLRLDRHLAQCPACTEELARLRALRTAVRRAAPYHAAPPELRARLLASLPGAASAPMADRGHAKRRPAVDAGTAWRRFLHWFDWSPPVNAGLATLTVAALGLAITQMALRETPVQALERDLVASHVRALVSGHGIDVVSSDRHTVKPWFNGRLDYAPQVRDLSAQGFPLVGGRLDYLDGRRVAVLVYRRNQHPIDVFVLPADTAGARGSAPMAVRKGYQVGSWNYEGMWYWAVTDASAEDLRGLREAWLGAAPMAQ